MCGIAGILSFKEPVGLSVLKRMTDAIPHRGPDGEGHWINTEKKIGLGHRRLSIIDLSENGHQPMHYADGRYSITFNGEIYNYIELRDELLRNGYKFRSECDTEVLLALYDFKKEKCLDSLDGMFSFAIWDEKEQQLFAARDRFGEKPFYYYKDDRQFIFASEIKEIFAAGIPKQPDYNTLYYYLAYGIEGNPNDRTATFYKNIFQLLPAHYMMIKADGSFKTQRYWNLEKRDIKIPFEEAVQQFTYMFRESIKKRLRSDVPVGSCLSGGLDSSSIVLSIDQMKSEGQVQKTFSARFKDFEKDEGRFIDAVVKKTKAIDHHEVWLSENDYLDSLEAIIKNQDEPFGGASVVAQYHVMKLAKSNHVTVLIDGQGSDEYLAGYTPFYTTYLNQLYASGSSCYITEKQKMLEYHGLQHKLSMSGKAQLRAPALFETLSKTKKAITGNKARTSSNLSDDALHAEFLSGISEKENPHKGKNNDNLSRSIYNTINGQPFQTLLRYADRNSMAHSIEVRLPFLSHELVEFAYSLPDEYKIFEGWSKYILRKSMEAILPSEIAWRKDKIGFAAPHDKWMLLEGSKAMVRDAKSRLESRHILKAGSTVKIDEWRCLMAAQLFS